MAITLSNAMPVQLWATGDETFNNKVVDGVTSVCFCQPFECDDPILFQFKHDTNRVYTLKVSDVDGNELELIPFTQLNDVSPFLYSASFTPSDYGICNETVKFSITYNTLGDPEPVYFYEPSETPIYFSEPSEESPVYIHEPSEL